MFPFNKAILLGCIWTRKLRDNAMLRQKRLKGSRGILPTSIRSESFYFGRELSFNQGFEQEKFGKHFRFGFKRV